MSTIESTERALDWPYVLEALAGCARTSVGKAALLAEQPRTHAVDIEAQFDRIDEIVALRALDDTRLPLGGIEDIGELLVAAQRGAVLGPVELCGIAATVDALAGLYAFLDERRTVAPGLADCSDGIVVDAALRRALSAAFDARGELSAATYPVLGELRRRILTLTRQVREKLEQMLVQPQFSDVLQDRYITEVEDRFVIPIKADMKGRNLGIVHDASRRGRTVYVEPHDVVPMNNERRIAEAGLAEEERRILAELSAAVGAQAEALDAALAAAAELDGAAARATFAERLEGTRPQISDAGCIRLRAVRHPVLQLRSGDVVANDLAVDAAHPVLVLTGPNAGGKTVALKAMGLCVLLSRIGCFIPAAAGSRVDLFDEVAVDIGDQQTVHEGLSSFSGHLTNLKAMLAQAGPGTLLLLDELCSGTDPAQGGALARALIERFADLGTRVVATTHYAQVKTMPAVEPRVAVAAMEYTDDSPTFRVVPGLVGQSHALSAARRIGMDGELIQRARALMDEGERALTDALVALEEERARSQELARAAEEAAQSLAAREAKVDARELRIRVRARQLEQEAAEAFVGKLRDAGDEVREVLGALRSAPNQRAAQEAGQRFTEMRELAEQREPDPELDQRSVISGPVGPGDRVRVKKLNALGDVIAVRGDTVEVAAGGMTVRVQAGELERVAAAQPVPTARPAGSGVRGQRKGSSGKKARTIAANDVFRSSGNTVDLRGERVESGLARLETFLDSALLRNDDAVFVLHGHGTGAMKAAVRRALAESAYVHSCGPAEESQGGDAYTVVILRD